MQTTSRVNNYDYTVDELQILMVYFLQQFDDERSDEYFTTERRIHKKGASRFVDWLKEEDRKTILDSIKEF